MAQKNREDKLRLKAGAYKHLLSGSDALLNSGSLDWTEKLLLLRVRKLSQMRLQRMFRLLPGEKKEVKAALLEAVVEATAGGHSLGQWEKATDGWQASCVHCYGTIWIGEDGFRYSLLEDSCTKGRTEE